MEDLSDIISDDVSEPTPVEPQEPAPEGDQGAVEPQVDAAGDDQTGDAVQEPEPQGEGDQPQDPHTVPVGVVQELRGKNRNLADENAHLRQQLAQQQTPQTPEFLDPEGAEFVQKQTASMMQHVRLDMSEDLARQQHGDDAVDAAFEALQNSQDQAAYQSIMSQRSPWMALVNWHNEQQTFSKIKTEVGGDLDGWMAREREKIRAEIRAEMVADQAQQAAAQPAPSMAGVNGVGGGPKNTWNGPADLDDLL